MEPFDILCTPARMRTRDQLFVAVFTVLGGYLLYLNVRLAVQTAEADRGQVSGLVGLALGAVVLTLLGRMLWPQWLILSRYHRQDRGKQVLTFRLDETGWRWLQIGTDVLVPWESLTVQVQERTDDRMVIRLEHPEPVLCATDVISRRLHRALRKLRVSDIPFTLTDPTEDELATAIAVQSGGRVTLTR